MARTNRRKLSCWIWIKYKYNSRLLGGLTRRTGARRMSFSSFTFSFLIQFTLKSSVNLATPSAKSPSLDISSSWNSTQPRSAGRIYSISTGARSVLPRAEQAIASKMFLFNGIRRGAIKSPIRTSRLTISRFHFPGNPGMRFPLALPAQSASVRRRETRLHSAALLRGSALEI